MKFIKSKKGVGALLVTLVVVAVAAFGAYAYFTNSGTSTDPHAATVGSVNLTGSFSVSFDPTSYTGVGSPTSLFPTVQNDPNQATASVPWAVTNLSEANEAISTYTVEIDPTWSVAAGHVDAAHGQGCSKSDFSINGLTPGTADVQTVGALAPPKGTDPVLTAGEVLKPNSDAPHNQISGTATIELIDNGANQNDCIGATPDLTVSASS